LADRRFYGKERVQPRSEPYCSFFELDRDAFTLLVMGFTGAEALNWKLKYIAMFNAMETAIHEDKAAGGITYDRAFELLASDATKTKIREPPVSKTQRQTRRRHPQRIL